MPDLISIFCEIDDFCNDFEKQIKIGKTVRGKEILRVGYFLNRYVLLHKHNRSYSNF